MNDPISTADILGLESPEEANPVLPVEIEPDERTLLYAEHDQLAASCRAITVNQIRETLASQIGLTPDTWPECSEAGLSMIAQHRLETMAEHGRPSPSDEVIQDPLSAHPPEVVQEAQAWAATEGAEQDPIRVDTMARKVQLRNQAAKNQRPTRQIHRVEPIRATPQRFHDGWGVHIRHEDMPADHEEPAVGMWVFVIPRSSGAEERHEQISSVEVETPYGWLCRTGGEHDQEHQ